MALSVTDNGNGTYTLSGTSVTDNGDGTWTVTDASMVDNGNGTWTASSVSPDPLPMSNVHVEIAFASDPDSASQTWTDVTGRVDLDAGISITRGRQDQFSSEPAGTLSLTLDNRDGALTPGYASGTYYPNVKAGKRIRVWHQYAGGAISYRFTGHIERYEPRWPGGADAQVVIEASDRLKRVGSRSVLKSGAEESILSDDPVVYLTLGDAQDSTSASNSATQAGVSSATVNGSVTFGAGTGPGKDGLSAATFAGGYLEATISNDLAVGATDVSVRATVLTSTIRHAVAAMLRDDRGNKFSVGMDTSGHARAIIDQYDSQLTHLSDTAVSSTVFADGATHDLEAVITYDGGGTGVDGLSLRVDGTEVATATSTRVRDRHYTSFRVGDNLHFDGTTWTWAGTLSHAAAYDLALTTTQSADHSTAVLAGYEGDSSDARVGRVLGWRSVASSEQSLDSGVSTSLSYLKSGSGVLSYLNDVTTTEQGRLFVAGDGTLTFHARSRYHVPVTATLAATAYDIDPSSPMRYSAEDVINIVTVDRQDGPSTTFKELTSVTEYGERSTSVTSLSTSNDEVLHLAQWLGGISSTPMTHMPTMTLNLLTSPYQVDMLALELGDRMTFTGWPSQAASSTLDVVLEGYSEDISSAGWSMTCNTSDFSNLQVLIWDDTNQGTWDDFVWAY